MEEKYSRVRLDFKSRVISFNEQDRTFTSELTLDSERYEWQEHGGEKYLYDKFDNTLISEKNFKKLISQIPGKPIYAENKEVDDISTYIRVRCNLLEKRLLEQGEIELDTHEKDKSEQLLQQIGNGRHGFVLMCVDIAKSTKLSTQLPLDQYAKMMGEVISEIGEISTKFHGQVLKNTGDGVIIYFSEPSFMLKNDLAIECALAIRQLVYHGINQILLKHDYPALGIRIGVDSGDAYVRMVGSLESKRHKDILGSTVNLATKIQSVGEPGDILIGEVTERNLHSSWRQMFSQIDTPPKEWYKNNEGQSYKVFRLITGNKDGRILF